jgi:hypothetical protein
MNKVPRKSPSRFWLPKRTTSREPGKNSEEFTLFADRAGPSEDIRARQSHTPRHDR